MPLASGLGSQFGLAKETVAYGTVATPTRFFEFDSESLSLDQTYEDSVGLRANRTFQPSLRSKLTTRTAGGDVAMDVPTKGFGAVLDLLHGLTVAPVQVGATPAYTQTHVIGTSQPNKSATLQVNKPTVEAADQAFTYPGAVLQSASFDIDTGGLLKTSLGWLAQDELLPTTTPAGPALATATYASGIESWDFTQALVTITGQTVGCVRQISLGYEQPLADDRWCLSRSATRLKPVPNGFATIEGSMTIEWFNTSAYNLFRSGAYVEVILDAEGSVISGANKHKITFTISAAQIRGSSPTVSGPDLLSIDVPFVARDNGVAAPLQITYVSTDTTL